MNPIDQIVGRNIRARRAATGVTQQQLASAIGVKFQQIQKYETGANRVAASRLLAIADALDMPVANLFSGASTGVKPISSRGAA